jgi:hypothetical protein
MRRVLAELVITSAMAALLAAGGPTAAWADDDSDQSSNLAIRNKSKWAVHHLYMSATKEDEWGPDQLGSETIDPGETFKLHDIPCNTYDLKVVDEDGDECVIEGEKFCSHEASWSLSEKDLLDCEGYGENGGDDDEEDDD